MCYSHRIIAFRNHVIHFVDSFVNVLTLLVIIPFIFTLLTSGSAEILGYRFEIVQPYPGIKTYYSEDIDIIRPSTPTLYGDSIVMQGLEEYEAYTAADGSTDISGELIEVGTYGVETYLYYL